MALHGHCRGANEKYGSDYRRLDLYIIIKMNYYSLFKGGSKV